PKRPPRATGTGLVSSQRMKAQMLSPSMSTCTDAGGPISRPGSRAHSPPGTLGPPPSASPLTGRYGLSVGPWAKHAVAEASIATKPHNAIHRALIAVPITHPPCGMIGLQSTRILYDTDRDVNHRVEMFSPVTHFMRHSSCAGLTRASIKKC